MAYGVKYRCEFKDRLNNTVRADILQDGFSGTITYVKGSSNPLSLNWPGDRENIFKPVRGAQAKLSMIAETDGQFNEFFDAGNKEYQLRINKGGLYQWKGWLMLSDYYESMNAAPYEVTVSAYDLGYLQELTWDKSRVEDESIIKIIAHILEQTGLDRTIKDEVNIYEDSIYSGVTNSMLRQINIHQAVFMDDSWNTITYYEALQRILLPFNSFVVQERASWVLCRIADLPFTHRQRVFSLAGDYSGNTSIDRTELLSSFEELNRSGVMMACPNYKELSINQDYGLRDLINNGLATDIDATPTDYWTVDSGTGTLSYGTQKYVLSTVDGIELIDTDRLIIDGNSTRTILQHNKSYKVRGFTRFELSWEYEWDADSSNTATTVSILIKLVHPTLPGSSVFLDLSDGSWSTSEANGDIVLPASTIETNQSGSIISDTLSSVIRTYTLEIYLKDANWSSGTGKTYFNVSLKPIAFPFQSENSNDLSITLDADNLEDSNDVTFHFGDIVEGSNYNRDLYQGSLTVASDGSPTDSWTPLNEGGRTDTLLNLARECYQAQYEKPARRIQSTLFGDMNHLTILKDSSGRCYLAGTLTREFRDNRFTGEWLEIKQGTGAELVTSWENHDSDWGYFTDNSDTTFTASRLNLSSDAGDADARTNSITVDSDYYYRVEFSLIEGADAGTWGLTWGTESESSISDGDIFYLKPGSNTNLYLSCTIQPGDLQQAIAGISVKKYYGV